ncbi:DUF5715 family protein [Rubrivirga marina]|uniref:Uncharacterized protein n=1 Tax=Rubrivirga marina TaxID=1196024 RepID=A0A271IWM2_9BACT|nr:DUF5715 family protein [Rubrivirga marina]PAP75631.1 hypothetical protein BSZ37_03860 [Rubrivirga marina]
MPSETRSAARTVAALAVFFSLVVAVVGWAGSSPSVAVPLSVEASLSEAEREAVEQVRTEFAAALAAREADVEAVDTLSVRETGQLRRSLNRAHVSTAARLGVAPVPTDSALAFADGLRPLDEQSPYYTMRWRTGPLTPDALAALDAIGERFHERLEEAGLPPFRFVVSSAFRTAEHQNRLRGVNANAARGRSSHEYGTTFDIAYTRYRFDGDAGYGTVERPEMPDELSTLAQLWLAAQLDAEERAWGERMAAEHADRLEALLGRALVDLEDDGVLLALREVRQPCFHVTVARPLA